LTDADRRFWILVRRWFWGWRETLLIVKPETVIGWHRKGWRAYWRWRSRAAGNSGRRPICDELRLLIRRMASENILWGQRRIQAELATLGFKVSARTVAKYMRIRHGRGPSPGWRTFLNRHTAEIWACDFFCVQTLWFKTLYAFFVVSHASREVLHVQVTQHSTAEWVAQQIVECCGWDRSPPRFLIRDRDSRYGALFDRRLENLGITQVRTPFRAPQANSIAERWVRSVRQECLDYTFICGERHLRRVLAEYVSYFNQWRPHRSIGQRAACAPVPWMPRYQIGKVVAAPVLRGLHHVYQLAA
jgi:transposase InsO family protein